MIVSLTNLGDYILGLIAVCGEVNLKQLYSCDRVGNNYSKEYISKTVRKLIKDKLILKHEDVNGEWFRIRRPDGLNKLEEIEPDLRRHFLLMVGETQKVINGKIRTDIYIGNKNSETRRQQQSEIIFELIEKDFSIDHIELSLEELSELFKKKAVKNTLTPIVKQTRIFDDKATLPAKDLIRKIPDGKPIYLTSRAFLGRTVVHEKKDLSRNLGIISFGKEQSYMVYYIEKADEIWTTKPENDTKEIFSTLYGLKTKNGNQRFMDAIFFVKDTQTLTEYLCYEGSAWRRCCPDKAYNHAYLLPLDAEPIKTIMLLFKENGPQLFNREYMDKQEIFRYTPGEYIDALFPDETEMYNMFTCDYCRLVDAQSEIDKGRKVKMLVRKGQEKAIAGFLKIAPEQSQNYIQPLDNDLIQECLEKITGKEE